jgi:hypothetical protein
MSPGASSGGFYAALFYVLVELFRRRTHFSQI